MYSSERPALVPFNRNLDVIFQKDLMFDLPGTKNGIYDFTSLCKNNEELGMYWVSRLAQGHHKLGRQVIIEVGHHNRLSPFETAVAYPNTTVIGIEVASITLEEKKLFPFYQNMQNSVVGLFQYKIEKLKNKKIEVDRVQVVAPDPLSEYSLLDSTYQLVRIGGEVVIAIDPWVVLNCYNDQPEQKPDEIVKRFKKLHSNFEIKVDYLEFDQIKERYGFGDSKYLKRDDLPVIPVVIAKRLS